MDTKVDKYIAKNEKWSKKLTELRSILLNTDMTESFKWSYPVYSIDNKNVLSIGAFKNHFGIWFFNGVFLKDKYGLLVNAQESTKAMRQIRFEENTQMDLKIIKLYVLEAIENQRNGLEIKPVKSKSYDLPKLLGDTLKNNGRLNQAFKNLTFSKQKDYANYISEAKQEKTKLTRLEKIKPMISAGIGLNDRYIKR